ncbi:MAG: hypothetical protein VXZ55_04235, partial [Planctomycetota bacterium]|nr:hypothetical protein [Planctomycetota bacterium]
VYQFDCCLQRQIGDADELSTCPFIYPTNFSITEPRFGQFMARFPVRQAASGEIAEGRRCRLG